MAEYFEKVQWAVRPTVQVSPDRPRLGPVLTVNMGPVTHEELRRAVRRLRRNRAKGVDEIPGEFWKLIMEEGTAAADWVLEFCETCWAGKQVPEQWHLARVAAIFKKGKEDDCANYRPISLLCVAYKMFASVLLWRLKDAGAEERVWSTQYGFRGKRSTAHALFVARRMIEATWDQRDGKLLLLALDWAKAFDSVSPQALCGAMRRFGIPDGFIDMVRTIYADRRFFVQDDGAKSGIKTQSFGISQGCPLSPFLFVIMMSVLMHDAAEAVEATCGQTAVPYLVTRTLLYADDTLILEGNEAVVQTYMENIAAVGKEYGLTFNWSKLELLRVRHEGHVRLPSGTNVKEKDVMVYLGGILSADGRISSELSRRLGAAAADFSQLETVWKHANISRAQKVRICSACVVEKLMYCLHTAVLNKSELRKLDGFYARCLRKIYGIQHAYWSRVSNKEVYKTAGRSPLRTRLLERQLYLFGEVALHGVEDPMRACVFEPDAFVPRKHTGTRRQGRPRQTWAKAVHTHAVAAAGSQESMESLVRDRLPWRAVVQKYCANFGGG